MSRLTSERRIVENIRRTIFFFFVLQFSIFISGREIFQSHLRNENTSRIFGIL